MRRTACQSSATAARGRLDFRNAQNAQVRANPAQQFRNFWSLSSSVIHTDTLPRPAGMPSMDGYDFDDRPFLVFWEITRACALACQPLPRRSPAHRHPDELITSRPSGSSCQLAEWQPPMLILTGGDPLMRRDALDLVREATRRTACRPQSRRRPTPDADGFCEIKAAACNACR